MWACPAAMAAHGILWSARMEVRRFGRRSATFKGPTSGEVEPPAADVCTCRDAGGRALDRPGSIPVRRPNRWGGPKARKVCCGSRNLPATECQIVSCAPRRRVLHSRIVLADYAPVPIACLDPPVDVINSPFNSEMAVQRNAALNAVTTTCTHHALNADYNACWTFNHGPRGLSCYR